jgi:hypothetical protein
MEERPATLGIQVELGPDADAEEVAEATLQLRRELLDLDVDSVDLAAAGQPPPGTRGVELAALGALLVSVTQSQLLAPCWRRSAPGWAVAPSAASSWSWKATPSS